MLKAPPEALERYVEINIYISYLFMNGSLKLFQSQL